MELADQADAAWRRGEAAEAKTLIYQAFEAEQQAAEQAAPDLTAEPTRSVLHRSAASLAMECGQQRVAERLIATALAGNPPDEITEELRDLLQQLYATWSVAPAPAMSAR